MITKTSDAHLQEDPDDVLERSFNFSPEPQWENRSARMQRIVTFMEQRHNLALARQHDELDLAKQITDVNHFHVRLTNMVRDSACPAPRSFIFCCRADVLCSAPAWRRSGRSHEQDPVQALPGQLLQRQPASDC